MFEETAKLLKLLETGFIVCLFLTIVFFLISIILFFVFNIKQVYMILSGKAAKRDIRKLEEENFNTGRLSKYQSRGLYRTDSLELSQEFSKTQQMDAYEQQQEVVSVPQQQYNVNSTTVLGQNETTVLNGNETTVLNAGETTVLSQNTQITHHNRMFSIIKNEMLIHTEEVI